MRKTENDSDASKDLSQQVLSLLKDFMDKNEHIETQRCDESSIIFAQNLDTLIENLQEAREELSDSTYVNPSLVQTHATSSEMNERIRSLQRKVEAENLNKRAKIFESKYDHDDNSSARTHLVYKNRRNRISSNLHSDNENKSSGVIVLSNGTSSLHHTEDNLRNNSINQSEEVTDNSHDAAKGTVVINLQQRKQMIRVRPAVYHQESDELTSTIVHQRLRNTASLLRCDYDPNLRVHTQIKNLCVRANFIIDTMHKYGMCKLGLTRCQFCHKPLDKAKEKEEEKENQQHKTTSVTDMTDKEIDDEAELLIKSLLSQTPPPNNDVIINISDDDSSTNPDHQPEVVSDTNNESFVSSRSL